MLIDPRFNAAVQRLQFEVGYLTAANQLVELYDWSALGVRTLLLLVLSGVALLSASLLLVGLGVGDRRHRKLKSWLVFMSLVCLWSATIVSWQDVSWLGERVRVRDYPGHFESIASKLQRHWPNADGTYPGLGPYMAYPIGEPATLILLTCPDMSPMRTSFNVVERSTSGGLRFRLIGNEHGDWLEWHPPGRHPSSFLGGLLEAHDFSRAADLGGGWYLVRYKFRN